MMTQNPSATEQESGRYLYRGRVRRAKARANERYSGCLSLTGNNLLLVGLTWEDCLASEKCQAVKAGISRCSWECVLGDPPVALAIFHRPCPFIGWSLKNVYIARLALGP